MSLLSIYFITATEKESHLHATEIKFNPITKIYTFIWKEKPNGFYLADGKIYRNTPSGIVVQMGTLTSIVPDKATPSNPEKSSTPDQVRQG